MVCHCICSFTRRCEHARSKRGLWPTHPNGGDTHIKRRWEHARSLHSQRPTHPSEEISKLSYVPQGIKSLNPKPIRPSRKTSPTAPRDGLSIDQLSGVTSQNTKVASDQAATTKLHRLLFTQAHHSFSRVQSTVTHAFSAPDARR